jgi:hypothetical protein
VVDTVVKMTASDGDEEPRRRYIKTVGSRANVMHGTALRTNGGLTKSDLTYNSSGHIVSKKKQSQLKLKSNASKK